MTNRRFIATVAVVGMAAVFCIWSGAIAQTADLNYHASGNWRSETSGSGAWRTDFAMNGNAVVGVISFTGSAELIGGQVTGSAQGNSIELEVQQDGVQVAKFSGSVSAGVLVGNYQTRGGDRGVWAGSWFAEAPRIVDQWPAGTVLLPPVPVPDRPARPSGVYTHRLSRTDDGSSSDAAPLTPIVGTNVLVNNPNDSYAPENEPEVAIDKVENPSKLAAGANDYSLTPGVGKPGYYFSTDGGNTWPVRGQVPFPTGQTYEEGGDPVLAFDSGGRAFYAGLFFNNAANTANTMFVARALHGQVSYQNAVKVAFSSNSSTALHDKPWMAADTVSGSPYFGNVYVCWTKFETNNTIARVRTARSTNAGNESVSMTFDAGRIVSDDSNSTGCSIDVDRNGNVQIAWLRNGNQIVMDTCTNGGTTCGTDRLVANITPLPDTFFVPGNSFPTLAIDHGVYGSGYFVMVWADNRAGNADIYFTLSKDNGASWLQAKAIASTVYEEFFPTITIDGNSIQQAVYYQRTSTDPQIKLFNAYIISSGNGAGNFTAPTKINDGVDIGPTDNFADNFVGDYIGVDATTVRNPVWMDTRRPKPHGSRYQQDIYTTTVSGF